MREQKASLVAGLIVGSLGLLPLSLFLLDSGEAPAVTDQSSTQPETVTLEVAPPDLAEVDGRISRVLYAYGAADGIVPGATDELDDSIIKTLAYYDVTLTIPNKGDQ